MLPGSVLRRKLSPVTYYSGTIFNATLLRGKSSLQVAVTRVTRPLLTKATTAS